MTTLDAGSSRRLRRAWKRAHARRLWQPEYPERVGGFEHISVPLRRVLAGIEAARRERTP
jgi:hypothetical protein